MNTFAAVTLLLQTTMITIPKGHIQPLYGRHTDAPSTVLSFRMDRDPVTRGEFLAFVQTHPQWRRSAVRPLFAERLGYLADWSNDADEGNSRWSNRAVTGVSWFAARAYCAARSARLPSIAEWEYAAAASHSKRHAARDVQFIQQLVSLYSTRGSTHGLAQFADENIYGIRGLHGIGWEWVEDFNSVLVSDDSRNISERNHSLFCASAAIGAVDPSNYPAFLRYALRAGLTGRTSLATLGFRCVS